jgi:hypothetical protein
MKIQQTTLDKIKTYILETQANSTYNSSPHEPLQLCFYREDWNLGNCYKYLNRYLSKEGIKKGNEIDLLKVCHYAWLEYVQSIATDFEEFKQEINDVENLDTFFECTEIKGDLIQVFIDDDMQITDLFWNVQQYALLGILLIQQHNEHIDLEST